MTVTATKEKTATKFFEDAADRNEAFEDYKHIITNVISRRAGMLRAARMNLEDVRQELTLEMLELLDAYDPERCPNVEAYLQAGLKNRLVNMRRGSSMTGMPGAPKAGVTMMPITEYYQRNMKTAVYDTPSSPEWVEQEIDALPPKQRETVNRLLDGERVSHRNKSLQAARGSLMERLQQRDLQFA